MQIATAGSQLHGMGHLVRARVLQSRAFRRGWRPEIATKVDDLSSTSIATADCLVVDLPYAADGLIENAKRLGVSAVTLDYPGDAVPDLAISLYASAARPNDRQALVGTRFAVIRDDVRSLGRCPDGNGVLVVMGGADVLGVGPCIAMELAAKGQDITLISGPMAAPPVDDDLPFRHITSPPDFPELLAGCSWAVVNGGTTMLELMYLGKAVHVVPQTEAERDFALEQLARGALMGVGRETLSTVSDAKRRQVGRRASEIVDGHGADRILDLVEDLVER